MSRFAIPISVIRAAIRLADADLPRTGPCRPRDGARSLRRTIPASFPADREKARVVRTGRSTTGFLKLLTAFTGSLIAPALPHAETGDAEAAFETSGDVISDTELIGRAKDACRRGEFKIFMSLFARNEAVRAAFTAPKVIIRSLKAPAKQLRTIARENYREFNIAMIDYSWTDPKPAPPDIVHLQLKWTELPGNAWRIDYVRGAFDGQDEEGPGNLIHTIGNPGAYIFERRDGCWALTQDLR